MNVRKLLDWRKVLIYSHRWLGIAIGVLFVTWCISGIVLMYYGIPTLKAGERLMRLPELDAQRVQVSPSEAMEKAELKEPVRLRLSMLGDRPVYRFNTGRGFGQWNVVYADTGEKVPPMDSNAAMEWMRRFLPEQAANLRYVEYLKSPDHYIRIPAMQVHLPMHRIALDDAAGTEYYVSEKSAEAVVRADHIGRALGFSGYTLHRFFWWRQKSWYTSFLYWTSWIGIVMTMTGLIVGIWRYGITPRFRHKGVHSHSPYKGWMKWHHYAGLIFGLVTFTWIFSGAVDVPAVPGIEAVASPYLANFTPEQLAQGARSNQGTGAVVNLEALSVERIQRAASALASAFPLKEMELIEVGGKAYFVAYRAPTSEDEIDGWEVQSGLDSLTPNLDQQHVMVSVEEPERGVFSNFEESRMLEIAKAAMPEASVVETALLTEFDDYYYYSVASFNVGLMKPIRTLPALRVKFDDPQETWLYMSPSHGQMMKSTFDDRVARWALFGLHALDFKFLYDYRPLWDIVVIALMIGATVLSATTLVPSYRRLKRHGTRVVKWIAPRRRPQPQPAPQVMMGDQRPGGD